MDNQRTLWFIAWLLVSAILLQKWFAFVASQQSQISPAQQNTQSSVTGSNDDTIPTSNDTIPLLPSTPKTVVPTVTSPGGELITVTTDFVKATINLLGGVIERIEVLQEPVSLQQPEQGFPLLKRDGNDFLIAQDGLLTATQQAPNHLNTMYTTTQLNYQLEYGDKVVVTLDYQGEDEVEYKKIFTFLRGSYVIEIDYQIINNSESPWTGYLYGQFSSSRFGNKKGGFGQLPSYSGGVIYTEDEKYEKISFRDMEKKDVNVNTDTGWFAMMQHYFLAAWLPKTEYPVQFYSHATNTQSSSYRLGYKTLQPLQLAPGESGVLTAAIYLGSKLTTQLRQAEKNYGAKGLPLAVDYGMLTLIADPLFFLLSSFNRVINNWGWSIIFLTLLIKVVFYPLTATSYKSMAGMKKLYPRMQTLKERYADDKQKYQAEIMALYKKEKINPASGCLPILLQIPVFIALYWVLLESVEMRQAPFALWLNDLSAPDPYFILPVLMGVSMFLQQKLSPTPVDEIQKKVMMFMPLVLTVLFLGFPQGLVLYWVVNNVLTIGQQWLINRRLGV